MLGAAILAALAFTAIAASGAQASEWEVQAHTLAESGISSESTAGSGSLEIDSKVLGQDVQLSCAQSSTGSIATGGSGTVTLNLSGCTFAKPAGCTAKAFSLAAKTQLTEVGGVTYNTLTPAAEGSFGTLKIRDCAVEGNYPLKGSIASFGAQSEGQTTNQAFAFSAAISSAAGTSLTLGGNAASATGSLTQSLSGANAGKWWGAQRSHLWINGSGSPLGTETLKVSGGPLTFSWSVAGQQLKFSCSAVGSSGAKAVQPGGFEVKELQLTGCAVSEPTGCKVPSSIATEALSGSVKTLNGYAYQVFTPTGGKFFTLKVSSCSLEGNYQLAGSLAGKGEKAGTTLVQQPLSFSAGVNQDAATAPKFGTSPVVVTGSISQKLDSGAAWGVKQQ